MHIYQVIVTKPVVLAIILANPLPQIDEFWPVLADIFAQVTPRLRRSYLRGQIQTILQLVRHLFDVRLLASEQRFAERLSRPRENLQLNRRATAA
jgi:hypothetical protein